MSQSSLKAESSGADGATGAAQLRPRLCHLKKWSHFQGFGFNLHAEKTRNGQFIGKVDANSPAELAGLKEKDRIIEVNYVNISNENHQQVVKRIRNGVELDGKVIENEVVLLVVDQATDDHYKKLNVIVRSDFDNVLKYITPTEEELKNQKNNKSPITTPSVSDKLSTHSSSNYETDEHHETNNHNNNDSDDEVDRTSQHSTDRNRNNKTDNNNNTTTTTTLKNKTETVINSNRTSEIENYENADQVSQSSSVNNKSNHSRTNSETKSTSSHTKTTTNKATPPLATKSTNNQQQTTKSSSANNNTQSTSVGSSNVDPFKMSAAEFKNYLKNKPRSDPRVGAPVDMKQKFQMFQDM